MRANGRSPLRATVQHRLCAPGPGHAELSFQTTFSAFLDANAFYQQGDDGTAAAYGTAFARFDEVRIVAHIAAVPEASTVLLFAWGALIITAVARARRKSSI